MEIGPEGKVSQGDAYVELNDYDPDNIDSDTTVFYIRANASISYECCKGEVYLGTEDPDEPVNLLCLDIVKSDTVDYENAIFLSGETTLFINGEPFVLRGGGKIRSGVPPCPVCLNEPLDIFTIWTRLDGVEVDDSFKDESGKSLLSYNSVIDIRVAVIFAGEPVPDGTLVYVIIGDSDGTSLFRPENSIVQTFFDEDDNRSYADVRIQPSRMPIQTITETVQITSRYDRLNKTERFRAVSFRLEIEHEDIINGETPIPPSPLPPPINTAIDIFSGDSYIYDVSGGGQISIPSLQIGRGDAFTGAISRSGEIFISGGLTNNNFNNLSVTSTTERYSDGDESWTFVQSMPTPRYGGMTVVIEDNIYCIGGIKWSEENRRFEISNDLEVYHSSSGFWEILSSMPTFPLDISEGVARGVAEHIIISNGSQYDNYIYILCGISNQKTVVGSDGITIRIKKLNDKIFRYHIEEDRWSYVEISTGLDIYQRISPLSLVDGNKIIVFNGAWNDGIDQNNDDALTYHIDAFYVDVAEVINNNIYTTDVFAEMPVPKYHSAIVRYPSDSSNEYLREGSVYYIFGGSNVDSGHLDIVEKVDTRFLPYDYDSSYDENSSLASLPIGMNGANVVFAYIGEYQIPSIFILGGFTDGTERGKIEIIIN